MLIPSIIIGLPVFQGQTSSSPWDDPRVPNVISLQICPTPGASGSVASKVECLRSITTKKKGADFEWRDILWVKWAHMLYTNKCIYIYICSIYIICIYIYVCVCSIYIYIIMYQQTHIVYIYILSCTKKHTHKYIYIYIYTHQTSLNVYIYIYLLIYLFIYLFVCIRHVYIYIRHVH